MDSDAGSYENATEPLDAPSGQARSDEDTADVEVFEKGACNDLVAGASTKPLLKSYAGMKHEIIFEEGLDMDPGKNKVVDDIVEWLKGQGK